MPNPVATLAAPPSRRSGTLGPGSVDVAEQRAHERGLRIGIRLAVVPVFLGPPELDGLVPITGVGTPTEEIPEPQVVQPLGSSVLDAVQVSYPVPRSSFEDEDVTPVLTCVASVDPTGSFQSGADRVEIVKHGQTDSKINDRLREKSEHRRRADLLDPYRNVLQALRHPVPQ